MCKYPKLGNILWKIILLPGWGILKKFEIFFLLSSIIDGNTHIFPAHGFGEIFPVNPYDLLNLGKANPHSKEKKMEKHKHSKVKSFINISVWKKIRAITKAWDEWTSFVLKKYGKSKHSRIMSFLNISCEAEIHIIPKPRDEFNSSIPELVWENTGNSQVKLYFTYLELMETHAITNAWECENFHIMEYSAESHITPRT